MTLQWHETEGKVEIVIVQKPILMTIEVLLHPEVSSHTKAAFALRTVNGCIAGHPR